jgi:predicted AAA+ superfamily ATPase
LFFKFYYFLMEEKLISREYALVQARPYYDDDYIKAIMGIRRSGKSKLLLEIIGELKERGIRDDHILFYDLEGESGEGIVDRKSLEKRLKKEIKGKDKYYIFIDEVQHIRKFEVAIASVRVSYNCSLFVTGSNSKLLRGRFQDRLTGRAREIIVQPFSFKEHLAYKKANGLPISEGEFFDYLKWGGMPQRYKESGEGTLSKYLSSLYSSIVAKDVYASHPRINKDSFALVASYILKEAGKDFSSESVSTFLQNSVTGGEFKADNKQVASYASDLLDAYFVREIKPFYLSGKRSLKGERKLYAIDTGFRTIMGNGVDFEKSFYLENVIYNELILRGYEVFVGRTYRGEVDFVVKDGTKLCYIQVCMTLAGEGTKEREYGAFIPIKGAHPKIVICLDPFPTEKDGVIYINAVDFLLGKKDLLFS